MTKFVDSIDRLLPRNNITLDLIMSQIDESKVYKLKEQQSSYNSNFTAYVSLEGHTMEISVWKSKPQSISDYVSNIFNRFQPTRVGWIREYHDSTEEISTHLSLDSNQVDKVYESLKHLYR